MSLTHSRQHNSSISEKVYRILAWLTSPDSRRALILYGRMGSGKSASVWEAIEQLKGMTPQDRPIPKEITLFQEGISFLIFNLPEYEENHHFYQSFQKYVRAAHIGSGSAGLVNTVENSNYYHQEHIEQNILESKTIIIVTADRLPNGMADLLWADTMKFERE
jgi:hypothetical protein